MGTEQGTNATLIVRLIRSFQHRNIKHLVFHDVSLGQTVGEFIRHVNEDTCIQKRPGLPPPFRKHTFDTLKISHQPFGAKTTDSVINHNNDEQLILARDRTLAQSDIVNETELSYFNLTEYREYQANPPCHTF